jgi:hypothetical protein
MPSASLIGAALLVLPDARVTTRQLAAGTGGVAGDTTGPVGRRTSSVASGVLRVTARQ